eukprot:5196402-Karenia_brevis.AAC.1
MERSNPEEKGESVKKDDNDNANVGGKGPVGLSFEQVLLEVSGADSAGVASTGVGGVANNGGNDGEQEAKRAKTKRSESPSSSSDHRMAMPDQGMVMPASPSHRGSDTNEPSVMQLMEFMQTTQHGIQQSQNMMWQTMQGFFVQQQMQMSQIIERQNTRDRQFGEVLAGMIRKQ